MEQTLGIVIRWFRYSDSSLIVHWVTQDHGRLNTMARGALRAKSSFKGKLDLFNQCQLSFKRSRQSTLHTLHEVQLQKHHSALSRQLSRFEQTCYASQLISQCIEEDTPVEGLFELFDAYLMGMQGAQTESCLQTLCFECHLLDLLGSLPPSTHPSLPSPIRDIVLDWMQNPSRSLSTGCKALEPPLLRKLADYLGHQWIAYLGRPPKNRLKWIP